MESKDYVEALKWVATAVGGAIMTILTFWANSKRTVTVAKRRDRSSDRKEEQSNAEWLTDQTKTEMKDLKDEIRLARQQISALHLDHQKCLVDNASMTARLDAFDRENQLLRSRVKDLEEWRTNGG